MQKHENKLTKMVQPKYCIGLRTYVYKALKKHQSFQS